MESVTIRDATIGDAEALAGLAAQLGYPSSGPDIRARLGKYEGKAEERLLVAEVEGLVVAWTSIAVADHFYTPLYVEISGLIVDEKLRGHGIGALLIGEVKKWAESKGVGIVRLRANVMRKDAHRFYEREGFRKAKEQFVFEQKIAGAR